MTASRGSVHLTDAELFTLTLPPAGEPEALPAHLLDCAACARTLQAWKTAARDLMRETADPIESRTKAERGAAEDRTLELIRRSRMRRHAPWRWAVAVAAALFVGALVLPLRRAPHDPVAVPAVIETDDLSAADLADDTLLRDASTLASSDSAGVWNAFAAEPGESPRSEDSRL